MLIFEGCDLAGKTTLATGFADLLAKIGEPTNYVHCSAPKPPDTEAGELLALARQHSYTHNLIVDRFLIGDFAYRTVWPRANPLTGQDYARFAWMLRATKSHIFMLLPSDDVIKKRFAERGDDQLDLAKILVAAARYRLFVKHTEYLLPMTVLSAPQSPRDFFASHYADIATALSSESDLRSDLYYLNRASGFATASRRGDVNFHVLDTL